MRRRIHSSGPMGLLLLIYLGTMALANLLTPVQAFSETENRVLQEQPNFSLRTLLSGRFTSDYERYASDQIALRNLWIGIKTDADRALGKRESNGVFLGKGGYLMERYTSPPDAQVIERGQALQAFHQATPELAKVMMLVPTAAAFFPDKLPAYAPVGDQLMDLERMREVLPDGIRLADAYSALYPERSRAIFYQTDHHWTAKGAYCAYRELGAYLGFVPQAEDSFRIQSVTDDFYGSLHAKSGFRHLPADQIPLYMPKEESALTVLYEEEGRVTSTLYEMPRLQEKDKYAVFLDGNHALLRIMTDGPPEKKLLVVKDSYANSLIPFLTGHYGEIDVVDLRYYSESLLSLVRERGFQDMLILYNSKTFFEDSSISQIMEETS